MVEEQEERRGRMHAIVWLIVIFVPITILRLMKDAGPGPFGMDASFYYQLARHVMRGEGLISYLSLYHNGFHLPAPSWMYPAWPLLLGYSGRLMGLPRAAIDVPRILYLLDLLLLYALTRVIARRMGALRFASSPLVPDTAHLVTLLFAFNVSFYVATTHPYREGLAFGMTFAALLFLERYVTTRSSLAIAASGLFFALAYLSRVQMLAVGIGTVLVLLLDARHDRRSRRALVLYCAVAALVVLPWLIHLGFIPGLSRFAWRVTPQETLPMLQDAPRSGITKARIVDWLVGAVVEFQVGSPFSYVATFGVAALLAPLSGIVMLFGIRRQRRFRFDPSKMTVHATAIAGVVLFVLLLWFRSDWLPFFFGWRHGQTLIVLLLLAVPYLLRSRQLLLRTLTLALIVISLGTGLKNLIDYIHTPNDSYTPAEQALIRWLPTSKPTRPMILTTNAQALSVASDVYMHNTFCLSTPETTRAFLRLFPIDYVIVYERDASCPYLRGLGRELLPVRLFGERGNRIAVFKPKNAAPAR